MLWNLYVFILRYEIKMLIFYLDGSRGIYTVWTLLFSEKRITEKSSAFSDIKEK
jgi:HJR/Mrr/RecB family endonuclease